MHELARLTPTSSLDWTAEPPCLDPVALLQLCELAEQAADVECGLVTVVDGHGHEAGSILLYRGAIVRAFVQEYARPPDRRGDPWAVPGTRNGVELRQALLHRTAESMLALATHMHTLRWHGHTSPCAYDGPTITFGEALIGATALVAPELAFRAEHELSRRDQRMIAYWLPPPDDVPLPIATNTSGLGLSALVQLGRTAQRCLATSAYTGRANEVVVAGSLAIWTDPHVMYVAERSSPSVAS